MIPVIDDTLLVQAIGLCGTLGGMAWPLFRTRIGMLLAQLFACSSFSVHFALLGADTAAAMNLLAALQVAAALPLGARPGFRFIYLLVLPLIAVGVAMTWNGLPSVFVAIASALQSLGRYQISVPRFRIIMLISLPFWFGHNSLVGSVPGMISDVVGMVLTAGGLLRDGMVRRRPA